MSRTARAAGAAVLLVSGLLAVGCATSGAGGLHGKPDPYLLRKQLAASLVVRSEWQGASALLVELVRARPDDADVRTLLGTVYREQNLFDEAADEYRRAVALDGRQADAHAGMGMLRDLRGDPGDAAVEDFQKAIKLAPDRVSYYNNLGFALYLRSRYVDAVSAYREGLRRDPTARRIRNNLGFAYGRLGHVNRAKREFQRGGTPAEAENNLGLVLEQNGDLVAACECYRAAERMQPGLRAVAVNLARACSAPSPPTAQADAAPRPPERPFRILEEGAP